MGEYRKRPSGLVFIDLATYISKPHPVCSVLKLSKHLNVGSLEDLRILLSLINLKTLFYSLLQSTKPFSTQNNQKTSHVMNAINNLSLYIHKLNQYLFQWRANVGLPELLFSCWIAHSNNTSTKLKWHVYTL